MTADLAQACHDLTTALPQAHNLTTQPDTQPTHGRTRPGSRIPGNTAAIWAADAVRCTIRTVEAEWRHAVTSTTLKRGGSDANTIAAITQIPRFADAVPVQHRYETDANGQPKPCTCRHCELRRTIERLLTGILVLPAIDLAEPARKITAPCPYCERRMLLTWPREWKVACPRQACHDREGRRPAGTISQGPSGLYVIAWADGRITYPQDDAA